MKTKIITCYYAYNAYLTMFRLTRSLAYYRQAKNALKVLIELKNEYKQDTTTEYKLGA